MDILDQIQQQTTRDENSDLQNAYHQNEWAQQFSSIPPVEKLRAARNLTDQVASAVERRQEIAAQTDANAQRIYFNSQRFKQWQDDEPKRANLLQSQIDHQKALSGAEAARQKFATDKEKQALDDVAGFYSDLAQVGAAEHTPEYKTALIGLAHNHPRFIATPEGRSFIENAVKTHEDVNTFMQNNPAPEGYQYRRLNKTASGDVSAELQSLGDGYDSPDAGMAEIKGSTARDFRQSRQDGKFFYSPKNEPRTVQGDSKTLQTRLSHLESIRGRGNLDSDQKAYFDGEINSTRDQLKQIDETAPTKQPSETSNFDTPESYTAAFKAAPSGTVLHYKGVAYTKP